MSTSAIITISIVWGIVISITSYLFYKVLRSKKQPEDID
jgi:uncharacterized membrane protein